MMPLSTFSAGVLRCFQVGSWPAARHDKAQWLGTDTTARGRKKQALGCLGLAQSLIKHPRKCARGAMLAAVALLGPAPRLPRQGISPGTAHRSCWRARPSKDQCQPSVLFACVFGRAHLHRYVALDGLGHDAERDWQSVCRAGRRPRWDTSCFQFPVRVSALVCLFVCSSVLRVHVQLCVVSPAGPGLFRAQSRGGRIAELWKRIKLHHKTFHTVGGDPRRPDASQAACEGCGDPPLGALRLRTGDGLPQAPAVSSQPDCPWTLRAAVRLVHDHGCGAVRQCCVRQVLSPVLQLPQALSKDASNDNLWKLKPKMHNDPGDV